MCNQLCIYVNRTVKNTPLQHWLPDNQSQLLAYICLTILIRPLGHTEEGVISLPLHFDVCVREFKFCRSKCCCNMI